MKKLICCGDCHGKTVANVRYCGSYLAINFTDETALLVRADGDNKEHATVSTVKHMADYDDLGDYEAGQLKLYTAAELAEEAAQEKADRHAQYLKLKQEFEASNSG